MRYEKDEGDAHDHGIAEQCVLDETCDTILVQHLIKYTLSGVGQTEYVHHHDGHCLLILVLFFGFCRFKLLRLAKQGLSPRCYEPFFHDRPEPADLKALPWLLAIIDLLLVWLHHFISLI